MTWGQGVIGRTILRSTLLVLLFVFLVFGDSRTGRAEPVEVFYFQIGVETLIPITPVDTPERTTRISQQATHYALIDTSDRDFTRLREFIRDADDGRFNEYAVRVMLVFRDSSRTYIDNFGGVWATDGEYSLSSGRLREAQEILERITRPRRQLPD